ASSPFAGRFGGAVLADLNGDHNDDVAALQLFAPVTTTAGLLGDGSVHTLLSNGDGTFTHKAVAPTPINRAAGIDAADFNGDGKLDFIVAGSSVFRTPVASIALTGAVAVIPGLGGGSLGNANVFRIGALPAVQAVADVNNDGLPDIITG